MRILSLTGLVLFFFQSLIELSAIPVLAENSFWLIPFSFSNSKILSLIVFMTLPSYSQYIYKLTLFYISISPVLYFVNTDLYIYKNFHGIQHPDNTLNPALDIKIHHPVQRNVAISVLSTQNYMIAI